MSTVESVNGKSGVVELPGLTAEGELPSAVVSGSAAGATALQSMHHGLSCHPMSYEYTEWEQVVNYCAEVGTLMRFDISWSQAASETSYVELLEKVVNHAQAKGVSVIMCMLTPPGAKTLAANAAEYGAQMATLATKLKGKVLGWEIWNEPNEGEFGGSDKPEITAANYAAAVKTIYPLVKAADPSARVIAGVISLSSTTYLKELYTAGMKGYYDAISIHPYCWSLAPWETNPESAVAQYKAGLEAMRAVQVEHGDVTPLYLTELGWSTSEVKSAKYESGVTEANQATFIVAALVMAEQLGYVAGACVYELTDYAEPTVEPKVVSAHYGVRLKSHVAKAAFAAMVAVKK